MPVLLFMSETEAEMETVYLTLTPNTWCISQESIEEALRESIDRAYNHYGDAEVLVNLYEVERPVDSDLPIRGAALESDRNPKYDYEIVRQSGSEISFEELDDINNGNYNISNIKSRFTKFIDENFDF